MKKHIKDITNEAIRLQTKKLKKKRSILISIVIIVVIIFISMGCWSILPIGTIAIGVIWYILPVKHVRIYPEDIRQEVEQKYHLEYKEGINVDQFKE